MILSIAIPVYNFGDVLSATLETVLDQAFKADVEVLVLDGRSTDQTSNVVKLYQKNWSNLRYVRALSKGGIDVDMARCVELTTSEYCWLFSGDDLMSEDAVVRVLDAIQAHKPDLILGRHNECNYDMSLIKDWPVLSFEQDVNFDLYDRFDRKSYLESALSSEAFFSFMGGLIVKRKRWLSGNLFSQQIGSNWAHIGRLWDLANRHSFKLSYMHDVILSRRGGNDSFSDGGMLSRLDIQINGLLNVMSDLFSNESQEIEMLKRVVKSEVHPHWISAVRADLEKQNASQQSFDRLETMIARLAH